MKKINIEKQPKEKNKSFVLPEDYYNEQKQQTLINLLYLHGNFEYSNYMRQLISKKVSSYMQQDKKKDRIHEQFITLEETIEKLVCSQLNCKYCNTKTRILYKNKRDEKQWTLDRIDNDRPHTKDNVLISCLECNLKRRRIDKDKFEFTKKLNIVKI